MADPDLELRERGGGFVLLSLPAFLPAAKRRDSDCITLTARHFTTFWVWRTYYVVGGG